MDYFDYPYLGANKELRDVARTATTGSIYSASFLNLTLNPGSVLFDLLNWSCFLPYLEFASHEDVYSSIQGARLYLAFQVSAHKE